jgi:putative N-acetylmannosamine-6-phosphate epimerase
MIESGIIVSIQKYTLETTQELSERAIDGGAVAIRTDQPIRVTKPVIGLEKLESMKYYITTTIESLNKVQKWANYIAIDSRRGNQNIDLLYSHCHVNNIGIIADVQNIKDVENLLTICEQQGIIKPQYISTTFSFLDSGSHDNHLIEQIKTITNIPIIAEGHCNHRSDIMKVKQNGANNICIGTAISDIKSITNEFVRIFDEVK